MPFPILRLPYVPFHHVYQSLEFIDLISLSQCSKSFRKRIQAIERSNDNTIEVELSLMDMHLQLTSESRKTFKWSLYTKRNERAPFLRNFVNVKIDGINWTVSPGSQSGFRILSSYNEDLLIFWTTFLKTLFNCKISLLHFDSQRNFNFQKLFIHTNILHTVRKFHFEENVLSNWEMEFLLEKLQVEDFKNCGFSHSDFRYTKPIRFKHFTTNEWPSDNFDNLLSSIANCETVRFHDTRKSEEDIKVFIKQWLESDNVKLEKISFERAHKNELGQFDLSSVIQDLPVFPGSKKKVNASRHIFHQDIIKTGMDIRRRDGVVATIAVCDYFSERGISFTVWNHPDPFLIEIPANYE